MAARKGRPGRGRAAGAAGRLAGIQFRGDEGGHVSVRSRGCVPVGRNLISLGTCQEAVGRSRIPD